MKVNLKKKVNWYLIPILIFAFNFNFRVNAATLNGTEIQQTDFKRTINGIEYQLVSYSGRQTIAVVNGANCSGEVEIPSGELTLYNSSGTGKTGECVELILDNAFKNCTNLTKIKIADSVTKIGQYAFYGCSSLSEVTMPKSLVEIGRYSFRDCISLKTITMLNLVTTIGYGAFYDCTDLSKVRIGTSVTSIGEYAFYGCSGLSSINIPNAVITIGNSAFSGCSGLTSINIPNSVTSIGESAFARCTGLSSISIPNSVTSIGWAPFLGCSKLENISVASDNTSYDSRENCNAIIHTATNTLIDGCKNTTILNSIREIGAYAFYYKGLTGPLVIHDSITTIEYCAFCGCSGLTKLTLGESVTSIVSDAFSNCSGLKEIVWNAKNSSSGSGTKSPFNASAAQITSFTFGENVNSIPKYLCSGMSSLKEIQIPKSVSSIGEYAFSGCTGLESVIWNAKNCNDFIYKKEAIPPFNDCRSNIKSFTLGDSVEHIPAYLRYQMSNLKDITIPKSVVSIGDYAFYCNFVSSDIVIPDSVTTIGAQAFAYNYPKNLVVGESVSTIGKDAFLNWESYLTSVTWNAKRCQDFDVSNTPLLKCNIITSFVFGDKVEHIPAYLCYGGYMNYENYQQIIIPDSVISIGEQAFAHCKGMKGHLTLPNSLKSIGELAFYDCDITSVTIGESLTTIEPGAFARCDNLKSVSWNAKNCPDFDSSPFNHYFEETFTSFLAPIMYFKFGNNVEHIPAFLCSSLGITDIDIPNSVTTIGRSAFNNCIFVTNLEISKSVMSIGEDAFLGCSHQLNSIVVENGNTCFDSRDNCNALIDTKTNTLILGSKNTTIPESVTSIGENAFYKCSGLSSVTIPESVTSIGRYAFYESGLSGKLTIPETITSLGDHAFSYCSELDSIVWNIKNCADLNSAPFSYCEGVTSFEIGESVENIPAYLCESLRKISKIEIPASVKSIGKRSFYNCRGLTSINIPNKIKSIGSYTFADCTNLTSINIPDSITSIGESAFANCYNLTGNIKIPSTVTSIGERAFYECRNLSGEIEIPNSVTSIEPYTFYNCKNIRNLVIGQSVASIGEYAFASCINLEQIDCKAITPPTLQDKFPTEVSSFALLYVQNGKEELYESAYGWSDFAYIIGTDYEIFATSISLDKDNLSLKVGKTTTLIATVLPEVTTNNAVKWTTSDENIITVDDNGDVTAVSVGSAYVTATTTDGSNLSASCLVTVEPIMAISIELTESQINAVEGSEVQLSAIILPENTTNKEVVWCSSDESVATVDNTGLVSIHKVRTVTITATTTDGSNLSASCEINGSSCVEGMIIDNGSFISINNGEISVMGDKDMVIAVYKASGELIYRGENRPVIVAEKGVYIVVVNGKAVKVKI